MPELEIVFDSLPSEALSRMINLEIDMHNVAMTGVAEAYPAHFFLKSQRGEWLGGLLGEIWGGWLYVKSLWVAECVRNQGHGARLLDAAERYAIERGCAAAHLETHNAQARALYERRGYEVFGRLDDWPPGHAKYFLRKSLSGAGR